MANRTNQRNHTLIRLLFIVFISSFSGYCFSQSSIIPLPLQQQAKPGFFDAPQEWSVAVAPGADAQNLINIVKEKLTPKGFSVSMAPVGKAATLQLMKALPSDTSLGTEGYRLEVKPSTIMIWANEPTGHAYGLQSLFQLMPADVEGKAEWKKPHRISCISITDKPRFGWRGLMLDVSRHFFSVADVKMFIDQMAMYKYNLLHLHLTDDEGWRIEIKGMPRLTAVGAWNVKKEGYFGRFAPPKPDEPRNYGGFYTHDDIKELVRYAAERYVQIMPEIDVPGHSLAAVVSYPHLSCTPGADKYVVRSGEPIMDWSRGAPPLALVDNTLCPANEHVYTFLDTVIAQVASLFPFPYIHLGGDEAPHNFWEKNERIKALMAAEGLKTMEEVQSYFTRRVEKLVAKHGKKMMGWDEILEGNKLPPSVAVMSWRGMKQGIAASKSGHEVIMSPVDHAYFDYMQGDVAIEPRVYATLRLKKVYDFEPAPPEADQRFIKGGQANLWSEQVYHIRHAQYMIWPRALAMAEVLWTAPGLKNWNQFFKRVETHMVRFDSAGIKYAPSVYEPLIKVSRRADSSYAVMLETELDDLVVRYSFDNTFPDAFSPIFTGTVPIPTDAAMLRLQSYRNNRPVGRLITAQVADLKARVKK